ncbi:MAG: S9 family peptidase [Candidatus Neomarinimicrobiota bacterium]|jgi:dipeptidyl aminopeptidase/acylaminoacyl peptidase|nr:S9 family peptidase [Candidatus Neomarinimicrobiota bacterium]MEC7872746.1 S9 family peptidase [Candidatus Neomarinimicrobiota bacterium]MED5433974.1 S9 family peptidase [Candidatus Neomarinimicrobiota bacterium]|tara:strand:+ start:10407 stop:12377 length:1971 start_codon:yes stop_codon:yes gene_type:complete
MKKFLLLFINLTIVFADKPITAKDIINLEYVSQPVINIGGTRIAYVKTVPPSKDSKRRSSYREIWVTDIDGTNQRKFTSSPNNSWSPQWTPNGNLSFLSTRKAYHKSTQVYIIPTDGGEAIPLTDHSGGIGSYKWSPNGRWIAFTSRDRESIESQTMKKNGLDMIVMGENQLYNRLWIYDVESKTYETIFRQDLNVSLFEWSPDSKFIIFQAAEKVNTDLEYLESSIYLVKAPSGNPRKITETPGKLSSMSISPNNDQLAFLGATSYNDPLAQSIFVLNIKNGKSKLVTPDFKESFVDVEWIDDQTVIGLSQRGTKTALSTIFLTENLPEEVFNQNDILAPKQIISSFSFHKYTKQLVIIANSNQHPNELYVGLYNSKKMKRITFSNSSLTDIQLSKQETISWKARDGKTIEGVLTYPLVYRDGKRYPLILQIHGGPEGVSLDGWNTRATYPVQLLAANGYFVLEPNYRGSAGRGVAYSKLDHDDLGGEEFNDVLKGIDHLIKKGFVDKNQVGTGGWSYGGYFSALAATKYSNRFKASMVGAGLTNMISFMGTTDIPYEMSVVHWNQWWFDNQELHWDRSPLSHINKAGTPTLVIHGLRDERVHPEQGMQLWQALKIKNVDTELVLYPREPHGIIERPHQLDYMERLINWYKKYVK